ncbi:MAG: hypothetical protein Kow0032_24310 [Methyloligellaceae bacterium]
MKKSLKAIATIICLAAMLSLPSPLAPSTGPALAQSGTQTPPTVITPPAGSSGSGNPTYLPPPQGRPGAQQPYPAPPPGQPAPYPAPQAGTDPYQQEVPEVRDDRAGDTYSNEEILSAGHRFFGRVSAGLAKVVEHAFKKAGRPNGYILGEEAGGAFVVGLRYGEGVLHTKNAGKHKVFWQGPSIGYDFGAEGSKTMTLVYNLQRIGDIYNTFGGIDGSAYFIGGVGVTFLKHEHVTLAPIRAGVGLRLGANVGYLKFTRRPTWNPF